MLICFTTVTPTLSICFYNIYMYPILLCCKLQICIIKFVFLIYSVDRNGCHLQCSKRKENKKRFSAPIARRQQVTCQSTEELRLGWGWPVGIWNATERRQRMRPRKSAFLSVVREDHWYIWECSWVSLEEDRLKGSRWWRIKAKISWKCEDKHSLCVDVGVGRGCFLHLILWQCRHSYIFHFYLYSVLGEYQLEKGKWRIQLKTK